MRTALLSLILFSCFSLQAAPWQRTSIDAYVSAAFPGKPARYKKERINIIKLKNDKGIMLFFKEDDPDRHYNVRNKKDLERLYTMVIKGIVGHAKGKQRKHTSFRVGNILAARTSFTVKGNGGRSYRQVRGFFLKKRIYFLTYSAPYPLTPESRRQMQRFFSSLRLKKGLTFADQLYYDTGKDPVKKKSRSGVNSSKEKHNVVWHKNPFTFTRTHLFLAIIVGIVLMSVFLRIRKKGRD